MITRRHFIGFLLLVVCSSFGSGVSRSAMAEPHRAWKVATLVAAERRDDPPEMERKRQTTYGTDNSGDATTTTTTTLQPNGLQRLWMYYTVQSEKTIYVARIGVNAPWTKRITAEAGSQIKCAVDGKKLYVLNGDGTEAKAEIMSTRMALPATTQPNRE